MDSPNERPLHEQFIEKLEWDRRVLKVKIEDARKVINDAQVRIDTLADAERLIDSRIADFKSMIKTAEKLTKGS